MAEGNFSLSTTGEQVRFELESDEAPEFWQFLNGLAGDDLLVELIVNDLDAGATRTSIEFYPDKLICAGNGRPVDEDGWKRLRLLRGAGRKAPAKKGLFGIKNHGLKACFIIGNEIVVRSSGKQILQTLFANGHDQPAYPGVRRPPIDDAGAPEVGTQIEVSYRHQSFRAPDGEPFEFAAASNAVLELVFLEAVRDLPRRLLGIVRPMVVEAYELQLRHHCLGEATLRFKCGRWTLEKGLLRFGRSCEVTATPGLATESTYERSVAKSVRLGSETAHATFFSASSYRRRDGKLLLGKEGLVLEVSWPVSDKGKPLFRQGKLRYPVSYYGDGSGACSGFGFEFSAPFRSDAERHELGSQSKAWNEGLLASCDELAAVTLAQILVPQHGPDVLKLVSISSDDDRFRRIVTELLRARALPAIDRSGKAVPVKKGQLMIVPCYTSDVGKWSKTLARVCPPGSAIIHSSVPTRLIALLGDKNLDGWQEDHFRFDETDVLDRLRRHDAKYFPWQSDAQRRGFLSNGAEVAAHLDALFPVLDNAPPAVRESPDGILLPDSAGELHPFSEMKRGISLPAGLLDVAPPPVLHDAIRDHKVFRLRGWTLGTYDFSDLLASSQMNNLGLAARKRFLVWLSDNAQNPKRDDWPALKALPIWASTSGELVPLDGLCKPRDPTIAKAMGEYLLRPTKEVLRICSAADSPRVRVRVRSEPTAEEVVAFYRAQLTSFSIERELSAEDRRRFHLFESSLLSFGTEGRLAAALSRLSDEALALDGEGHLRRLREMVRSSPEIERLALPPRMILDRLAAGLDKVLPPLSNPSWDMVTLALRDDPANIDALLPRLRAIGRATSDPDLRRSVHDVPCIPHEGRLYCPGDLAFKGNSGDYWGQWKVVISGKALPDDVQDLYRSAGVIRSLPEASTSRSFFAWLSVQSQPTIAAHIPQVIRHIAHGKAMTSWWLSPPEVPCIPVESEDGALLLTVSDAVSRAVVNDFPTLADEMRAAGNSPLLLAIDSAKTSNTPVADELRAMGIPGLRGASSEPLGVRYDREISPPVELERLLGVLRSEATARQLRKQLKEFDVRGDLLEPRWQRRLAGVQRVRVGVGLRAAHKVRRRTFFPRTAWAVLADAGEFWLEDGTDLDGAFFGAVADLVFTERHRYLPLVLRAALEVRVHEYHNPQDSLEGDADVDPDNLPRQDANDDDEPGESTRPHPGAEPDLSKNKPSPRPLFTGGMTKRVHKQEKASAPQRPQVVDENIQRQQLKGDHYAWHCQIALATAGPADLSPAGSYSEFQENRQKMVEAHHPDKVTAGGVRNAGNLLILSHMNHERFGRKISRQQVTDALAGECALRTIRDCEGNVWVKGVVAQVFIPANGEVVPVFFTHEHRSYWLKMAGLDVR